MRTAARPRTRQLDKEPAARRTTTLPANSNSVKDFPCPPPPQPPTPNPNPNPPGSSHRVMEMTCPVLRFHTGRHGPLACRNDRAGAKREAMFVGGAPVVTTAAIARERSRGALPKTDALPSPSPQGRPRVTARTAGVGVPAALCCAVLSVLTPHTLRRSSHFSFPERPSFIRSAHPQQAPPSTTAQPAFSTVPARPRRIPRDMNAQVGNARNHGACVLL